MILMKKLILILKKIFNSKFYFKSPPKKKLVVFDGHSFEHLIHVLKKGECIILETRFERINKFYSKKMGYKLKTHSGASKRFKKTGSSVKSKSAHRNHILTKQSTKRKRHNRGLNKLHGTVLKMVSKLINK